MPAHHRIDTVDPCAEWEVLVTSEEGGALVSLRSALDGDGADTLSDLSDACVRILRFEIAVYRGLPEPLERVQDAVDMVAAPKAASIRDRRLRAFETPEFRRFLPAAGTARALITGPVARRGESRPGPAC